MTNNALVKTSHIIDVALKTAAALIVPPDVRGKPADDLIKRIAMDVGKEVVAHIEHAYPQMFLAASESAKLSVRNATYNAIMAAGEAFSQGLSEQRLAEHTKHRKVMRKLRKGVIPEESGPSYSDREGNVRRQGDNGPDDPSR